VSASLICYIFSQSISAILFTSLLNSIIGLWQTNQMLQEM